jgi:hypothetical protein
MSGTKKILVVAVSKKVEALRMASGLTLLDDQVSIATIGEPPAGPAVDEQLEALDFADVVIDNIGHNMDKLACHILRNDVVFCV